MINITVPTQVGTVFLIYYFTFEQKYDILFIYIYLTDMKMDKLIFEKDAFTPDETSAAGAMLANIMLGDKSGEIQ